MRLRASTMRSASRRSGLTRPRISSGSARHGTHGQPRRRARCDRVQLVHQLVTPALADPGASGHLSGWRRARVCRTAEPGMAMDDFIRIRGAREHNLQVDRSRSAAQQAGRDHRAVGLGQKLARVRHDLRRRPAPLRREPVRVRAPVPRADAEAGRRFDHRPVAGDRDRAEDDLEEPALDGRHGHRDLRLSAPAVRARSASPTRRRPACRSRARPSRRWSTGS